jgi:hypothetical protein
LKPVKTTWKASSAIEIARKGVIEAKAFIMERSSVKKPAQIS